MLVAVAATATAAAAGSVPLKPVCSSQQEFHDFDYYHYRVFIDVTNEYFCQ